MPMNASTTTGAGQRPVSDFEALILDHAPVLIWVADAGGECTWFNHSWLQFTGRSMEQELGSGWREGIHKADAEATAATMAASMRTRAPFEVQYRLRRADGAYRWVSSHGEPQFSTDGVLLGYVAASTDIHEATELRQRLWSSQRRLQLAQRSAGLAIWEWDLQTNEVVWSPELAALHGIAAEDYDKSLAAYMVTVHPGDRRQMREAMASLEHTDNVQLEYRVQRPTGGIRWLASWATVTRDAEGDRPISIVGMAMDITERKAAEERLARSAANLHLMAKVGGLLQGYHDTQGLMEAAAQYTVDEFADLCVVDTSRGGSVTREFVLHREPALDVGAVATFAPELSSDDPIGRVILTGEPLLRSGDEGTEWWLRRWRDSAPGALPPELRPRSVISAPIRWRDETFGAISLFRTGDSEPFDREDLALGVELAERIGSWMARARLIEELEGANSAKDEFLGLVSHELKNPLTTIVGLSNLLAERGSLLGEAAKQEAFDALQRDASRLGSIIENMLTLARVSAITDFEPLLLQRTLPIVIERWRRRHPLWQIELHCEGNLPPIDAVPTWIEQVIDNLIGNAIKYSHPRARVEVTAVLAGDTIDVSVTDFGDGIDDETAGQLFTPFFRGNPHLPAVPGLGLGLTVCRRIVERLGGEIWIESPEGAGTSVHFSLPILPDTNTAVPVREASRVD